MYKNGLIDSDEFKEHKEVVIKLSNDAKNNIVDKMSYNTSFVESKYNEMNELRKDKQIIEINNKIKKEEKIIRKKIKVEKRILEKSIKLSKKSYESSESSFDDLKNLNIKLVKKNKQIVHEYQPKLKRLNNEKKHASKNVDVKKLGILIAILVPALLLIGLFINYLVYLPNKPGGHSFEFNKSTIPAFAISIVMIVIILLFTAFLIKKSTNRIVLDKDQNSFKLGAIGFTSSFFDILGVGCFATSMGLLKGTKSISDDKMVPGTLNMSFAVPILIEGSFLISAVQVNIVTLVVLVTASIIGSYIGAGIVDKVNTKMVKLIISVALFIATIIMITTTPQISLIAGGNASGLSGWKFGVGIVGFLIVGILMSFGVGSYAPSIVILGLLGMGMIYIAPIMMSASAFLMPITSYKFYRDNNYLPKTSLALMIGGIFGATVSFIVFYIGIQLGVGMDPNGVEWQSMIKWLTIGVMLYSSAMMMYEFIQLVNKKETNVSRIKVAKRKPLNTIDDTNKLKETIVQQINGVVAEHIKSSVDTKSIVIEEHIPINEW